MTVSDYPTPSVGGRTEESPKEGHGKPLIDKRQVLTEAIERYTRVNGGEEMQGGSVLKVRYQNNTDARMAYLRTVSRIK